MKTNDDSAKYRLCLRALGIFPFSVEAYLTLGNLYKDNGDKDQASRPSSMLVSALTLWPELSDMDEIPWVMLDFRPYLRAVHAVALGYEDKGAFDKAIEHYRYLLRVNEGDNQGCSMLLFNALIAAGHSDQAEQAAEQYAQGRETFDCFHSWGFCLIDYQKHQRGRCTQAQLDSTLLTALDYNPFVPDWLFETRPLPPVPDHAMPGGTAEALSYVIAARPAWRSAAGALAWLQNVQTRNGLRLPDNGQILFDLLTRGKVRVELTGPRGLVQVTTCFRDISCTVSDSFEFPAGTKEHKHEKIFGFDTAKQAFISFPYAEVKAVHFWHVLHTSKDARAPSTHLCHNCYASGANKRCGRCNVICYCSEACQKKHWKKTHKRMCAKYVKK